MWASENSIIIGTATSRRRPEVPLKGAVDSEARVDHGPEMWSFT
jgi:hypothetical protein